MILGKEHTTNLFALRADAGPDARIARHQPLQEATSSAPKENIPNVIISSRTSANSCQFLKFFLYGAIQLAGALLAANSCCPLKRSLGP